MRTLALLAATAALVCTATNADNARTLVLAGGHLPICSSMNLDACADDQRDALIKQWQQAEALFEAEYDPRLLRQLPPALAALLPAERVAAISQAAQAWPDRRQNRAAIEQAIARSGLQLSDDETLWLFERMDTLSRRRDEKSARLEQLNLAATDPEVRAVFQRFVSASQRNLPRKPRIGVFTSAAREPLDAAAFYQQWFTALGADVVWIPLDAASRTLRDRRQPFDSAGQFCGALIQERARLLGLGQFARADQSLWQHYCRGDDLLPLLQTLDGVFFNGGDQSLHVRALIRADGSDSPELALLRQRYHRGELAIMGTSAGTAVQSGNAEQTLPMISNGSTAHALLHPAVAQAPRYPFCEQRADCPAAADDAQLSYRRQGGLRFFSHGIVDTHFSQRARQGRLLMLLTDTAQHSGFGVDETTALVVTEQDGKTEFEVVGANGVWIAESVARNKLGKQQQITASAHYLRAGDRASRRSKALTVTLGSCGRSAQYKLAALDGERLINANGVNEAALQLQMLKTAELVVPATNGTWTFSRGKQFALCPKPAGGWSYRDLQIAIAMPERLP